MTSQAWWLLLAYLGALVLLAWPLGWWLESVAAGRLPRWMAPLQAAERGLYRLAGVDATAGMGWRSYAIALLSFNVLGVIAVYALQRWQGLLPLNPASMAGVSADSAFNTAISFVTNTNWQAYAGEATMSYLTQMLALAVQNFLSAATGMVVVIALVRGFVARSSTSIGNFWVDITRITAWVLLPLSLVFAVFLVSQGVIQNFSAYQQVATLEATTHTQPQPGPGGRQTIAMGPVASQEAIKMLGTNGGGLLQRQLGPPL